MKFSRLIGTAAAASMVLGCMVSDCYPGTNDPPSQFELPKRQPKPGKYMGMSFRTKAKAHYYNCLCVSCNTHFVTDSVPQACPYCGSGNVTCYSPEEEPKK